MPEKTLEEKISVFSEGLKSPLLCPHPLPFSEKKTNTLKFSSHLGQAGLWGIAVDLGRWLIPVKWTHCERPNRHRVNGVGRARFNQIRLKSGV